MGHKSPYLIKSNNSIIPAFISKPEQGSKSYEFSELIKKDLEENKNILSIYICPCRRNQANQAEGNFETYNDYYKCTDKKIDVLHGEKQSSKDIDGYIYRSKEEGQRMIISICHKVRLNIIKEIIIKWIKINPNHKVKLYLDEAGDSKTFNTFINCIWKDLEIDIKDLNQKIYPVFIDAHVGALLNNKNFKKYFPSGLYKLENKKDLSNYIFMSSLEFNEYDWKDTNDILEDFQKKNITTFHNDYILWPSPKIKIDQHEDAEEISSLIWNSCVLNINGDGYHIYRNINGRYEPKITLPKNKCSKNRCCGHITCPKCNPSIKSELDAVKNIRLKYSNNITFILFGHDCIDRAMTYQETNFSFTKVFIARNNILKDNFSDNSDKIFDNLTHNIKEKLSQMLKRSSGSFADKLITPPIIYGPKDLINGVIKLEKKSTHISKQTGYITKELNDLLDTNSDIDDIKLLTQEDIEKSKIDKDPFDYYFKEFTINGSAKVVKDFLSVFRKNIGQGSVHLKAIKSRENGVEKGFNDLNTDMFRNDINILKSALDSDTHTRLRVCKYSENIKWVITFLMKKNNFIWNGNNFNFTKIDKDGDCLFNSILKSNKLDSSLNVKNLRRKVKNELQNNKNLYDIGNQYEEDDWDDECDKIKDIGNWNDDIFDYCVYALSNLYDINFHIFNFDELPCGGYELKNDIPIYIPDNRSKSIDIYLRRLDDSHYDLMEIIS